MLKYLLLLFAILSTKLNSQINGQLLSDRWTRVKVKTEDGSRSLSESSSDFCQWKLINNKLCIDYDPKPFITDNNDCSNYKLEKNLIVFSSTVGYEVEKIDADSLIVIERFKGKNDPDKILKLWFVRTSNIEKKYIEKTKNDSVLIAEKDFTPKLKKDFISDKLSEYALKGDFKLSGNIIIDQKKEKIIFEMGDSSEIKGSANIIKNIRTAIENSYSQWNLSGFQNFIYISVPFHIESFQDRKNSNYSLRVKFFKKQSENVDTISKEKVLIHRENPALAKDSFAKGMEAFQAKKYETAIDLFEKAYKMDNSNTDALYNIAAASGFKNDHETACSALKILKDLEQTEGTKLYDQNCHK